jgi:hypothetical protein
VRKGFSHRAAPSTCALHVTSAEVGAPINVAVLEAVHSAPARGLFFIGGWWTECALHASHSNVVIVDRTVYDERLTGCSRDNHASLEELHRSGPAFFGHTRLRPERIAEMGLCGVAVGGLHRSERAPFCVDAAPNDNRAGRRLHGQ